MNRRPSALHPASPRLLIAAGILAWLAPAPARAQILPGGPPQPFPETVYENAASTPPGAIFWHNYDYNVPNWGGTSPPIVGTPTVEYSNVQAPWPGAGNIFTDPLFVNFNPQFDLRLTALSDCLESADYSRLPFDSLDVDGSGTTGEIMPIDLGSGARYVDDPAPNLPGANTWLDMGAYERQQP